MSAGPTVAVRSAAETLGITTRHVRRLITEGRLTAVGSGNGRRITLASIENYQEERKFADLYADMSSQCPPDSNYNRAVAKLLKTVPALSEPRSAARRLGIGVGQMESLIKRGAVPTIALGETQFVPARWLAETLSRAYGVPFSPEGEG